MLIKDKGFDQVILVNKLTVSELSIHPLVKTRDAADKIPFTAILPLTVVPCKTVASLTDKDEALTLLSMQLVAFAASKVVETCNTLAVKPLFTLTVSLT